MRAGIANAMVNLRSLFVSAELGTAEHTDRVRVELDIRESDGQLTISGRGFTLNLCLAGIGKERG